MDKVAQKIVALGVPGLVLLVAINTSGLAGAAAITSVLAAFGGPIGMLGGIGVFMLSVLIINSIGKYGFEKIFEAVVKGLQDQNMTKHEIVKKIDAYPISRDLKLKLKDLL